MILSSVARSKRRSSPFLHCALAALQQTVLEGILLTASPLAEQLCGMLEMLNVACILSCLAVSLAPRLYWYMLPLRAGVNL